MPLFSHLRRNLFFRKAILCIIPFCVFSENGFAASAKERCSGYKPTYVMAPNGAAETSQYDEEGRLISHLDFTGKYIFYQFVSKTFLVYLDKILD